MFHRFCRRESRPGVGVTRAPEDESYYTRYYTQFPGGLGDLQGLHGPGVLANNYRLATLSSAIASGALKANLKSRRCRACHCACIQAGIKQLARINTVYASG